MCCWEATLYLQKVKGLLAKIQRQGSVVSRLFMPQQVTEGKDLMTSVGFNPEEKLGLHKRCERKHKQRNTQRSIQQGGMSTTTGLLWYNLRGFTETVTVLAKATLRCTANFQQTTECLMIIVCAENLGFELSCIITGYRHHASQGFLSTLQGAASAEMYYLGKQVLYST